MADPNYKMSGGYTSLAASNLPGSVPAAAGVDHMVLPFQESNLQTFPPGDARGKLFESLQPLHDADDSFGDRGDGTGTGTGFARLFSIASYRPYFNVDTADVVQRIYDSFLPHRGDFVEKMSHNPDMYGPFWICTTLIFVAAALGNYSNYLSYKSNKNSDSWQYDIGKVNWAAAVFYGYTCMVPLALYFLLQYLGVLSSIVQLWCLYGYSLFIFIPATILSVVPIEAFKWLIVAIAGLASATFVALNIRTHIEGIHKKRLVVIIGSFVLQCCLALFLKLFFFS